MSNERELLAKLRTYKRRVFVLLGIGLILFPYSLYRIYNGHTQSGLFTLLPSIVGLAMCFNYLRVILRHEKVLQDIIAEEGGVEPVEGEITPKDGATVTQVSDVAIGESEIVADEPTSEEVTSTPAGEEIPLMPTSEEISTSGQ